MPEGERYHVFFLVQVGLENAKKERVAVRQAPKITVCTATGTETTMFASPTVEDGGDSWDSFTFDMSGMIFSEAGECSLLLEADFSELLEPELRADAPALSSSLEFRVSGGWSMILLSFLSCSSSIALPLTPPCPQFLP